MAIKMKTNKAVGRFFLVGCARSGTTLLQTMLASHSLVFSPPETHFFLRAPAKGRWRKLGLASTRAREALMDIVKGTDYEEIMSLVPRWSPFLRAYGRAFCSIMDQVTVQDGKRAWVEKTPLHIRRLSLIERLVEGARFIHVVRDGREVVASMYQVAIDHPEIWGSRTIEACIKRWNRDLQISLSMIGDPRHIVVKYEDLVNEPQSVLARLCDFMDLSFEKNMLQHWETADRVIGFRSSYPWMQKPFEPLQHTPLEKFSKVFAVEEQQYIEQRLLYGGRIAEWLHLHGGP